MDDVYLNTMSKQIQLIITALTCLLHRARWQTAKLFMKRVSFVVLSEWDMNELTGYHHLWQQICVSQCHIIISLWCHDDTAMRWWMITVSYGSALYVTGPSLQCCTVHRVALPELTDVLWHQTAAHSLCIITKQLLTTTESSCRMDPDSRRHTDLFNVVPLNALSCATHNADTNRKSLSVCLTVWDAENVFGLWTSISPVNAAECGISCECEVCLQRARGRCCHPIGCHGILTVYKILRHLHT